MDREKFDTPPYHADATEKPTSKSRLAKSVVQHADVVAVGDDGLHIVRSLTLIELAFPVE